MEKPMKSKRSNNFLSFLAKSTSFSNPAPFKPSQYHSKGFSGPLVHLVPTEARHKGKTDISSFETQEPTSPIVSCIGQIKQKAKKNRLPRVKSIKRRPLPKPDKKPKNSKNTSFVQRVFGRKPNSRRKLEVSRSDNSLASTAKVPTLEHMRRYESGRESLKDFDWRQVESEVKCIEREEDDVSVYYSAPLMLGGGAVGLEPKKEVNLWKRRTIGAPVPLKLDEL